jgi:hypothetical protein
MGGSNAKALRARRDLGGEETGKREAMSGGRVWAMIRNDDL